MYLCTQAMAREEEAIKQQEKINTLKQKAEQLHQQVIIIFHNSM